MAQIKGLAYVSYTYLTFSLNCLTSFIFTSASSNAAQTSLSMAFKTCRKSNQDNVTVKATAFFIRFILDEGKKKIWLLQQFLPHSESLYQMNF